MAFHQLPARTRRNHNSTNRPLASAFRHSNSAQSTPSHRRQQTLSRRNQSIASQRLGPRACPRRHPRRFSPALRTSPRAHQVAPRPRPPHIPDHRHPGSASQNSRAANLAPNPSPHRSPSHRARNQAPGVAQPLLAVLGRPMDGSPSQPAHEPQNQIPHPDSASRHHNLDLTQSYAYGNTTADIPMLESVAHPQAVNPTNRLTQIAHHHRWPILHWQEAPAAELAAAPNRATTQFATKASQ